MNFIQLYLQLLTKYLNQQSLQNQMDSQLLFQLDTVQNYITALFDSLPKLNIDPTTQQSSPDINKVLQQNIEYGRKIIQLSDKFTAKYRKDHFVDRKDIQQKIQIIFRYVCPQQYCSTLDDMVTHILKKIQQNAQSLGTQSRSSYGVALNANSRANSINHLYNFATKDSKVDNFRESLQDNAQKFQLYQPMKMYNNLTSKQVMTKSKISVQNLQPLGLDTNQLAKRKRSTNKSKVSKKGVSVKQKQKQEEGDFTTKNVLQIKTYFEQQETCIRKLLQKFSRILSASSNTKNTIKISQQNKQYTKTVNEAQKETIKQFVQANIQNNKHNLHKISDLIDNLSQFYERKSKIESLAQGKFAIYIQQINKRQEVYSFAVSKLIQNLNNLKQSVQSIWSSQSGRGSSSHHKQQITQIISSLQQLSQNFYTIYPSHSVLKDLKIQNTNSQLSFPYNQQQLQKLGYKNQGVQVSLGSVKNQKVIHKQMNQSKRNLLQLYKTNARVNQMIQKFERSTKFKKNVQLKQIQKFIQSIRDSFPKKNSGQFSILPNNITNQVISYQQDLKKIVQTNQKNERQLSEQYNKKVKKYEKQIQDLQKAIQQIMQQHKKDQQNHQTSMRKLTKKLQNQKQQNKKISALKNSLQKNIKQMSTQIQQLQRQVKSQSQKFSINSQMLLNQNKRLQSQCVRISQLNRKMQQQKGEQLKKIEQQRQIYHQKIIFLQTQEQTHNQQVCQVKYQLQQMIKENTVLKKQVEQLTQVYQQKIKQLQQLIQNIKQLENQLRLKNIQNKELKQNMRIFQQKFVQCQKQKNRATKQLSKIQEKLKQKQEEVQKYRSLGSLNQSDINILKQQMDKVKQAYIQSQQQLQQLRTYSQSLQSQRQFLIRQNKNYRREVDNYNQKWQAYQLNNDRLQKQLKQAQDQVNMKKKQVSHFSYQLQQCKREVSRLKKQLSECRDSNTKVQGELRMVRQQSHKKMQAENLQLGKRRLELEATKVQLRRKTEQLQKMKENYEQKIQTLESKNKQLSQFITQKQLLAKITTSHLSQ